MKSPWWLVAAFALGWFASWWFTRPDEDWRFWKRAAEEHLAARQSYLEVLERLERSKDSALAAAQAAEERSEAERARADRERTLRLGHQRRAEEAMVALRDATTPADSLKACMLALGARSDEASACARETERLRASLAGKDTAIAGERRALVLEEEAHALTRGRLWKADSLLQVVPNPHRCPLPFCLRGLVLGEWEEKTLFVGGAIPIKNLLDVGLIRRIH